MKVKLYTTDEIALICSVTVETVREWIKEGKLIAVKRGRSYLVTDVDLKSFLEVRHG